MNAAALMTADQYRTQAQLFLLGAGRREPRGRAVLMPVYEVRRRTVLAVATVTAANETEARFLARDVWQQDAAIAALAADIQRVPNLDPMDALLDDVDEARYAGGTKTEDARALRWGAERAGSDSEAIEPW